jgi:hypothetical protein
VESQHQSQCGVARAVDILESACDSNLLRFASETESSNPTRSTIQSVSFRAHQRIAEKVRACAASGAYLESQQHVSRPSIPGLPREGRSIASNPVAELRTRYCVSSSEAILHALVAREPTEGWKPKDGRRCCMSSPVCRWQFSSPRVLSVRARLLQRSRYGPAGEPAGTIPAD